MFFAVVTTNMEKKKGNQQLEQTLQLVSCLVLCLLVEAMVPDSQAVKQTPCLNVR